MSATSQKNSGSKYVFDPPPIPSLPVIDDLSPSTTPKNHPLLFPIHRVYCVGKNYADHVQEMGGDVNRSQPVFFTKPSDAVILGSSSNGSEKNAPTPIAYPPQTTNLHYECELVVAIGRSMERSTRRPIPTEDAPDYIFGFAVGLDLTRRDLQSQAKANGLPWDTAKYFDQSAPMGSIRRAMSLSDMEQCRIELKVNSVIKQSAPLSAMIWNVSEIISELSSFFQLQAGDLIMTGTPAGVGPVTVGDHVVGRVVKEGNRKYDAVDVLEPVDVVLTDS